MCLPADHTPNKLHLCANYLLLYSSRIIRHSVVSNRIVISGLKADDGKVLEAEPVSCQAESVNMVEVRSWENVE